MKNPNEQPDQSNSALPNLENGSDFERFRSDIITALYLSLNDAKRIREKYPNPQTGESNEGEKSEG